ncbi:hypothetical protein KFU94_30770 [Chloroflexi bacterium TSY]|nr:hypothetical protein [Chloroflexi bacterium TSY]
MPIVWAQLFWKGRLQEAIQHLKFAEIIKPNAIDVEHAFTYGEDPLIHAQVHRQLTLWLLGYPDRAAQVSNQAIQRGQQLNISQVF